MPRTQLPYDDDFRQEAVNLLLSSGTPLKQVAAELGISANALRTWRDKALGHGRASPAEHQEHPGALVANPAAEIRRLQREVDYLRRQREILKKAMSILSGDPPSVMR